MASEVLNETAQRVLASLESSPYACQTLDRLTGGTANFVYRGTLVTPLADGSKTVVVKHSEEYSATNRNFKISRTRCGYEQTILHALNSLEPVSHEGITIQAAHLLHFYPDINTQIYTDLPSSLDLKSYVLKHADSLPLASCSRLGSALGRWLRFFHAWVMRPEQRELVEKMKGNTDMVQLKYRVNYEVLVNTVDMFPGILEGDRGDFERVRDKVKMEIESGEGILIHGDFWTGNIVLPSSLLSSTESASSTFPPTKVVVLDWEVSQVSSPAYDLGQMIAEMYCFYHFRSIEGALSLIDAFIAGYAARDGGEAPSRMGKEMACKIARHVGVHLVCWGSRVPGWGTKEQVEDVVRLGRKWVLCGDREDVDSFLDGPLKGLFL